MQNFDPVRQRGPKLRASPPKSLSGAARQLLFPAPAVTWLVLGFCTTAVLPLDAMGRNATGCLEISLPTPNPGDGGVPECHAPPWVAMAPSRVGDSPSACTLPSPFPGEMSVLPTRHPLCAGSPRGGPQLTCGSGSPGKAGSRQGARRWSLPGCPER